MIFPNLMDLSLNGLEIWEEMLMVKRDQNGEVDGLDDEMLGEEGGMKLGGLNRTSAGRLACGICHGLRSHSISCAVS